LQGKLHYCLAEIAPDDLKDIKLMANEKFFDGANPLGDLRPPMSGSSPSPPQPSQRQTSQPWPSKPQPSQPQLPLMRGIWATGRDSAQQRLFRLFRASSGDAPIVESWLQNCHVCGVDPTTAEASAAAAPTDVKAAQ
jgi:hypothetical protein